MRTEITKITPEMAKKLLEGNKKNRSLSRPFVNELKRAIKSGGWLVTHQGIAIAVDGTVLDGQHRLTAIMESGLAVDVMVTWDCDSNIMHAVDLGRKRNAADAFEIFDGIKDAKKKSEPMVYVMDLARCGDALVLDSAKGKNKTPITTLDRVSYFKEYEEELNFMVSTNKKYAIRAASAAVFVFFMKANQPLIQAFVKDIASKEPSKNAQNFLANQATVKGISGAGAVQVLMSHAILALRTMIQSGVVKFPQNPTYDDLKFMKDLKNKALASKAA